MEAVASSFRIDVGSWLEGAGTTEIERFSLAELAIMADNAPVCELEDLFAKTVRSNFRASAYDLALWFVANWWRLRWEPERSTTDWRLSHQVGAAGKGFAWPALTFASDGDFILVHNEATEATAISPVRYLRSISRNVSVAAFEAAVDGLVETVLSRLSSLGHGKSNLARLAQELREERADPELSAWRKLEALLGYDPDEVPEALGEQLASEKGRVGEGGIEELAASELDRALDALHEIERSLAESSAAIRSAAVDGITWDRNVGARDVPWRMACQAAQAARSAWGVATGPITDKRLTDILDLSQSALSSAHAQGTPLAAGYRKDSRGQIDIVLRSRYREGRRFELMRIIGDCLIAAEGDHLLPVTRSKTFRQKFQRAFAQEVLCPWHELEQFVGPDEPDDDLISDAASHFEVSQRLIETTLVNKGRLPRDLLAA